MKLTLGAVADRFDLPLHGDPSIEICGIANILEAQQDELTFLFNPAYKKHLATTKAAAVVLCRDASGQCDKPCLISERPRLIWAGIAELFDATPKPDGRQHPSAIIGNNVALGDDVSIGAHAVIESNAVIGDHSTIGPGSVVGANVRIGQNTRLFANVTLYHDVMIGNNVIIHSGAIIGADGFGFEFDDVRGQYIKIPQVYGVVIADEVEIGAGTTIDRGALNHTEIGIGVKLDNQVQVGHGTRIGAHTVISGCTAIAGTMTIGRYCVIGGAVGIIDNITITDNVEITAMSLVSKSIKTKGRYSSGTGLMPGKEWKRNIVGFKQLANLLRRVRRLESGNGNS